MPDYDTRVSLLSTLLHKHNSPLSLRDIHAIARYDAVTCGRLCQYYYGVPYVRRLFTRSSCVCCVDSQTEGYSGSDLTALAKDAALGPIRGL